MTQTKVDEANTKVDKANTIVRKYMYGSVVVGIVPFPLLDLVALSGLQLKMLESLANLYKIKFSEHLGKSLIASLVGGTVPVSVSRGLVSLTKSVPFYGQITGAISLSILGGASTYAIGKVFIQHFESGGTFLTFEPKKVSDYYAQKLKEGKEKLRGKKP